MRHIADHLENSVAELIQIFMHVACGRDLMADTLCTSGFIDDVMFSYHGASGPELSTAI